MLKGLAVLAQFFSQPLIFFIRQTHGGVKQKCQQVEAEQERGKTLGTVTEVALEVETLGLQEVIVSLAQPARVVSFSLLSQQGQVLVNQIFRFLIGGHSPSLPLDKSI